MVNPLIAVPAVTGLAYRAWSRKSLTTVGSIVAFATAALHTVHPWLLPFILLAVFYFSGSRATKVKHGIKAQLTLSASGASGGEGPRTHVQVLANSLVATVLSVLHTYYLWNQGRYSKACLAQGADIGDILVVGIVANYAAVAADTFSSELGILSKSKPRLITSPTLRVVPPGTNGGVTLTGLLAGVLGAFLVSFASTLTLPFCEDSWSWIHRIQWLVGMTIWGTLGSILDSFLGGFLQASVTDKRTGKIVEGSGGRKVLIHPSSAKSSSTATNDAGKYNSSIHATESIANIATGARVTRSPAKAQAVISAAGPEQPTRKIESGHDILDNNAVNLLMAATMSVGAMLVASYIWEVPLTVDGFL
ncbi:DUF92 domain protein [Talaromyces proteolyticus]|uniref:DUF92 domain protein n=1 Tax=Talaromyces proteolyticus TaxID=1131652 RepID=A0AAD4KNA4_9EURO|nr:DUF92 domain protein [Talaromyces proteolyticus]KAH8696523.1 DUF92 domain protein [Talaromyces proteolyticus]